MTGDVRRVHNDGSDESWERDIEGADSDIRWVGSDRIDVLPGSRPYAEEEVHGWNVTVAVMEFSRQWPIDDELRRRIAAALRSVEGVETADEMDTEVWWVTGTPSGEALVRAVAEVVDDLADQMRAYYWD